MRLEYDTETHLLRQKYHRNSKTETAACVFNEGFALILKIMECMGVKISPSALEHANARNADRIYTANRRSSEASKEARIACREAKN